MNSVNSVHINTTGTNSQSWPILDSFFYTIIFWGWVAYICFAPIYLFDSGLPQPADLIIFTVSTLAIGVYLIKYRIAFNRVFATLSLMVVLFGVINLIYGIFYGDSRFFYAILYYVFNAMAFGTTIILFKDSPIRAFDGARMAIIFALALELIWVFVFPSNSVYRATGSFNNPNQLGYWAILASASILTLNYGRRMPTPDLICILICAYLIAESLSRAAIFSFSIIALALMIGKSIPMVTKVGCIILVCLYLLFHIAGGPAKISLIDSLELIDKLTSRLNVIEDNDPEKYSERGYQRLWEFPQYLIYGAGEGANWRFMDILYAGRSISAGREIHSGLATILFSYGIFGFGLFMTFLYTVFQRAPLILWLPLIAVMAYGLTHQNVRFTGFWIYLGLAYAMVFYILPQRNRAQSNAP